MERTKLCWAAAVSLALALFPAFPSWGEVEVGDAVISGSLEVGGMPGDRDGSKAKFEEYREIGVGGWIIPELQLFIGSKKEDFYLNFDATKPGFHDENYRLRFGRYGLFDIEAEWDQIPHLFSEGIARTPYRRDGGTFRLGSKPGSTAVDLTPPVDCANVPLCTWLNGTARPIDLGLLYGIGRIKIRYTPTPGWTFSGGYWSQHVGGDRAFGTYFGPSPGSYNNTELPEPIDYQTHNVEVGGEYAGKGWSVGLKYNGSFFHNNISTLVWDNPLNLSGVGAGCSDAANYANTSTGLDGNRGPCRGRLDLYPSNQAHTLMLSGAATLPLKSRFMGTVSYGWRLQDDSFLPFTINSAITQPTISRRSLDGDVRPLMLNLTVVNNFVDHLNVKTYYRYYDLDNRSRRISFPRGMVINDQAGTLASPTCNPICPEAGAKSEPFAYSKQNAGLDAGYDVTRWLTAKLGYGWEKMHREYREVRNMNEHGLGPTFDIKPASWVLVRASYRHFWRNADAYNGNEGNIARKFDEAERQRDRSSLFAQLTPWENLTFFTGFEFTSDDYPETRLGTKSDLNYSPSVGMIYSPLEWIKLFADYNWDRFDWRLDAMQRSSVTQEPGPGCTGDCAKRLWNSRGTDRVHTSSVGTDVTLIEKVLGFRIQYGYSTGASQVKAFGSTCATCTRATFYPDVKNTWHEFLARLEYQVHKNVGLKVGYYFNRSASNDFGVDNMKPWMGDVDVFPSPNRNVERSIFLGDKVKGPFTAHVGFIALRFSF
jgi:MtrB/PioB family decaheme-associated outer membrane protein